jgi:lipoprotein-anchoring transpeptidase ErfK/SrfK
VGRHVEVWLDRQVVLLVDDGGRVRTIISASSGAAGHDTPAGTFSVSRKELRSWSVPYSVWMPWASYFTGGIALHESASVPAYPASHGCVRLPAGFARQVYDFAPIGTPVIVS